MKVLQFLIFVLITPINLWGQDLPELPKPKKFISKVEIFAGPNWSFNYGNKFLENYKDDLIQNKRLPKTGYSFGLGTYHAANKWLDISAKVLWEQKGSNAELNVPLNPVNGDERLIIKSEYTYNYLTIVVAPSVFINKKNNWMISLGGYYSLIKNVKGNESAYSTDDFVIKKANFVGRSLRGFRSDGAVNSISFIPGLQSFEKCDYGITLGIGYLIKMSEQNNLMIQLNNNYGMLNINKPIDILDNPPEKNYTVSLMIAYFHNRSFKKPKL